MSRYLRFTRGSAARALPVEFVGYAHADIVQALIAAIAENLAVTEMFIEQLCAPGLVDVIVQTKRGAEQVA